MIESLLRLSNPTGRKQHNHIYTNDNYYQQLFVNSAAQILIASIVPPP